MGTNRWIGYIRDSVKAGRTLAHQRGDLARCILKVGGELVGEYVVAPNRANEQEQIAAALRDCKRQRAQLIVPFLDRIDRATVLIAALIRSRANFIVYIAISQAAREVVKSLNAAATLNRKMVSERVKAGVQKAKEQQNAEKNPRRAYTRTVPPPKLSIEEQERGRVLSAKARQRRAASFAQKVQPMIQELRDKGLTPYAIAKEFNERRIKTAGGKLGAWDETKIKRVMARAAMPDEEKEVSPEVLLAVAPAAKAEAGWNRYFVRAAQESNRVQASMIAALPPEEFEQALDGLSRMKDLKAIERVGKKLK